MFFSHTSLQSISKACHLCFKTSPESDHFSPPSAAAALVQAACFSCLITGSLCFSHHPLQSRMGAVEPDWLPPHPFVAQTTPSGPPLLKALQRHLWDSDKSLRPYRMWPHCNFSYPLAHLPGSLSLATLTSSQPRDTPSPPLPQGLALPIPLPGMFSRLTSPGVVLSLPPGLSSKVTFSVQILLTTLSKMSTPPNVSSHFISIFFRPSSPSNLLPIFS